MYSITYLVAKYLKIKYPLIFGVTFAICLNYYLRKYEPLPKGHWFNYDYEMKNLINYNNNI